MNVSDAHKLIVGSQPTSEAAAQKTLRNIHDELHDGLIRERPYPLEQGQWMPPPSG